MQGLADSRGVTFESVAYPGHFLSIANGNLTLQDGTDTQAATFYTSLDEKDTSLRTVAATAKNNEVLQGEAMANENISLTLSYADGTTKKTTDFTTNALSFTDKKPGSYQLSVVYKDGDAQRETFVPITIVVKPSKVTKLTAKTAQKKNKTTVKLSWNKTNGQKYEISYGKTKKQHKKLGEIKISKKSISYSRSAKTWKKGKSYYFHIRAYSKVNGIKKYSNYKTIKVKI